VVHVLKPGAVHNQRVIDALISYIRSGSADSGIRSQVTALLCQLLSRSDMFVDEVQLSSLDGVEQATLKVAEKLLSSMGSKATGSLPPALQDLLELCVAKNAATRNLESKRAASNRVATPVEAYPGTGIGAIIRATDASRPTRLDLKDIASEFYSTYPELQHLWALADETSVREWCEVSSEAETLGSTKSHRMQLWTSTILCFASLCWSAWMRRQAKLGINAACTIND
jgi:hypothetical protein